VAAGTTAMARFDQMMPVITSTLSAWIMLVGQLHRDIGLALVVLDDHLDIVAARLRDAPA
jgi:hypothetical protein